MPLFSPTSITIGVMVGSVVVGAAACQPSGPPPAGVTPSVSVASWGAAGLDVANYVLAASDGGTVIAGYTAAEGTEGFLGALIRLDAEGTPLWVQQYGRPGDSRAWSVAETNDGGFLVVGFCDGPAGNGTDVWVFRVDGQGTLLWEKTFGGAGDDLAWEIIRTRDGQFAVAAESASSGAGQIDAWLMKLDDRGAVLWDQTYGSDGIERVFAIAEDNMGQLYATGTFRPRDDAPLDVYTIAVHGADGELAWMDRLDQGRDDTGHGITIDQQGNLWVTGYTTSAGSGDRDGFIARYEAGHAVTFWTFGGAGDDRIMNLRAGPEGDLFFVGYARSFADGARFNVWLGQVTNEGELRHSVHHGSSHDDRGVHLLVSPEGVVAVGSFGSSSRPNDMDFAMFRVDFKLP